MTPVMETQHAGSYPRLSQRLIALLIDAFTVLFAVSVALALLVAVGKRDIAILISASLVVTLALEPLLVCLLGGTVGHHLLMLRVRRIDNDRNLSAPMAILRFMAKLALGPPGIFAILRSPERRAIHDRIAGSVVVAEGSTRSGREGDIPSASLLFSHVGLAQKVVVILVYWLLLFLTWVLVFAFTISRACIDDAICSTTEVVVLQFGGLAFVFLLGLVSAMGFVGRLYGCRQYMPLPDPATRRRDMERKIWMLIAGLLLIPAVPSALHLWLVKTDPAYQFRIARLYADLGLSAEAVVLMQVAADAEYPGAQVELGSYYLNGIGVERDCKTALRWLSAAAEGKDPRAMNDLGWMNESGCGIPQNLARAVELYDAAAIAGNPTAKWNLGRLYYDGTGVERNVEKSFEFFMEAAELGEARGQYSLATFYHKGEFVEKDMDSAMDLYERSAARNNTDAMLQLGHLAQHEGTTDADGNSSVYWYRRAAALGNAEAQRRLGEMFHYGQGVAKDVSRAIPWYERASQGGDAWAQYQLGKLYQQGEGVRKDGQLAYRFLSAAAQAGHSPAQWQLGWTLYHGVGVDRNLEQSAHWLRLASASGNVTAQCLLAYMYWRGEGLSVDYAMSYVLYSIMAGNPGLKEEWCNSDPVEWKEKAAKQLSSRLMEKAQTELAHWDMHSAARTPPLMPLYVDEDALKGRAIALVSEQRYREAAEVFLECAESGNGSCMTSLGLMYGQGRGVEKNIDKFIYWEERAVQTGLEFGVAGIMGALSLTGHYASPDVREFTKARYWLGSATELLRSPQFRADIPGMADYYRQQIEQAESYIAREEQNRPAK